MNKLIEARAEYVTQLDDVRKRKGVLIEQKVAAYRAQLEATRTQEDDEMDKLNKIIIALDEVIALETPVVSSEPAKSDAAPKINIAEEPVLSRPGMNVFTVPRD